MCVHWTIEFGVFSYQHILSYMLTYSRDAGRVLDLIRTRLNPGSAAQSGPDGSNALAEAKAALQNCGLSQLRDIATHVLAELSGKRPLLLLLDNIDQRPSSDIEANIVVSAVNFFRRFILDSFPGARAIISMRDSTHEEQSWIRNYTGENWNVVYMSPPDFKAVLQKRCKVWETSGAYVGEGPEWHLVSEILSFVYDLAGESERNTGRSRQEGALTSIIEARHPYNLGEQLAAFSRCCRGALLHRAALAASASDTAEPLRFKSFEFFVRVFLLSDRRYFKEEVAGIPNLFDAGRPTDPLNACIRGWVILLLPDEETFSELDFLHNCQELGLPLGHVSDALECFKHYDIIRPAFTPKGRWILSRWGRFFRGSIAFDLPYVSTIWWTTHMLPDYLPGLPRVAKASELESLANRFLRWLQFEESCVAQPTIRSKQRLPLLFDETSITIMDSLHRIELSLTRSPRN